MLGNVRRSVEGSKVIQKGRYPYVVTPLMDGVPRVEPDVINEAVDRMVEIGDFDCDLILAPEAMGIPYAALICSRIGKPFSVIRKRSYGLEGEIEVVETTGYSTSRLYINGVEPGMRVAIVDDVASTCGTLKGIVAGLRDHGIIVTEAVIAIDKSPDISVAERELGIPIRCVARISVVDGRVVFSG